MQNVFLIANSGKSRNPETITKFKEKVKPRDAVVFFNRFLRDLEDTFWIDFIRKNNDNILYFASRSMPVPLKVNEDIVIDKKITFGLNQTAVNKDISSYGLGISKNKKYNGGCICCGNEQIYKKFSKIFIFKNQSHSLEYKHSCKYKNIENKFHFIFDKNNFLDPQLRIPKENCSSGFLMILYFLKLYKFEKIYMVGFDHFGGDSNHPWFEERRFIDENSGRYSLERI